MEKKDIKKLVVVLGIILLVAAVIDMSGGMLSEEGRVGRNDIGDDNKEIDLTLDIEGVGEDYDYLLEIESVRPTREQAETYFAKAIEEIEKDFMDMGEVVPIKEEYQNGLVEAQWSMDPWNVINADGTVVQEKIPKDGIIVIAKVTLLCGAYEQIYQFPFEVVKRKLSQKETVLQAIEEWMETEMNKEGETFIQLPKEIEGVSLRWSEKREHLLLSVFLLEIVAVILLILIQHQKKEQEKKEWMRKLEQDYPEVVGQLTLLLGAGMNIRQAWNRIATRYSDKREKGQITQKPAFEGILRMNRRIQEGENERIAYQQFANETQNLCYHRLIRLLIGNLKKGTQGISEALEQESKQAYEQRILQAKKLGEEASTRMLLPLMLMMMVVMAIVMVPAMLSFVG